MSKGNAAAKVHLGLAIAWVVASVPTAIWFKDSVLWVAEMSCYANVYTSVSAWRAEKAKQSSEES
jgi:hypothetical protein